MGQIAGEQLKDTCEKEPGDLERIDVASWPASPGSSPGLVLRPGLTGAGRWLRVSEVLRQEGQPIDRTKQQPGDPGEVNVHIVYCHVCGTCTLVLYKFAHSPNRGGGKKSPTGPRLPKVNQTAS